MTHEEAFAHAEKKAMECKETNCLDEVERAIFLPVWAKGVVDNGGFKYLLELTGDLDGVAESFRKVGLDRAAAACGQVAALLPAPLPADRAARLPLLKTVDWEKAKPLNKVIFGLSYEEIEAATKAYWAARSKK
jgi:hypothetical protein